MFWGSCFRCRRIFHGLSKSLSSCAKNGWVYKDNSLNHARIQRLYDIAHPDVDYIKRRQYHALVFIKGYFLAIALEMKDKPLGIYQEDDHDYTAAKLAGVIYELEGISCRGKLLEEELWGNTPEHKKRCERLAIFFEALGDMARELESNRDPIEKEEK